MSVAVKIKANGKVIDPTYEFFGIDVIYEINRLPNAQIRFFDGDAATRKYPISESEDFALGSGVIISARTDDDPETELFNGVVVRHTFEASESGLRLVIDLKASAVSMTFGRKSAVYEDMTDTDVIKKLIGDNGLTAGKLVTTKPKHKTLTQYHCTDWDFMLARAEANGLLVAIVDDDITLAEIAISGSATHSVDFGVDPIFEIEMTADAHHQPPNIESVAWDVGELKLTKAVKAADLPLQQSDFKGNKAAKDLGASNFKLNYAVPVPPEEVQAWVNGVLARARLAFIRGRVSLQGKGEIKLLQLLELKGVSKRFTGKTLITGVRHRIDANGWTTDVQFGLPAKPFTQQTDVSEPPAAGLLPAVRGLHIGIVMSVEADPDKLYRIKITLPGIGDDQPLWARLATPGAGKERGLWFAPDVGDEVVVAFMNDDPRYPVILGGLFSSKNAQPKALPANDKNDFKALVTRSGISVVFDDEKKILSIKTPAKNSITLDDDGKQIAIKDQHGNTITLSQDGITLKSAKDFNIDASGKVVIKGSTVDVNA